MIRPIVPDDKIALMAVADAVGLFEPNELQEIDEMLTEYLSAENHSDSDHFWLVDEDSGLVGLAYCAPELMTEGTWNLQLIAVHPDRQGQGRGQALLSHLELTLTSRGARLLLVETSGMESFERTRAFYRKCRFEEEARIQDFYRAGDDKIVYGKTLSVQK